MGTLIKVAKWSSAEDPPNQLNNPYYNTYNLGWYDHPNFSYRNNNHRKPMVLPGFQKVTLIEPKKSNL